MNVPKLKRPLVVAALSLALLAPLPSYAFGAGELAGAIVSAFIAYFLPPVKVIQAQMEANTQLTAVKSTLANKAVAEGIAEWQVKEELRREAVRIKHSLKQPETTCGSLAQANAGPKIDASVQTATFAKSFGHATRTRRKNAVEPAGTKYDAPPVTATANATQQVLKNYDYLKSNFCTPEEQKLNRCAGYAAATKYPGGDIRPELLFSDGNGNGTLADEQGQAVDAFIDHIVDSMGPELLRNPAWDQTPEGRKYVLMVRDYAAFMNLSKHSLQTIQMNHTAVPGLGDTLELTKDPRFSDRHNVSKMEATDLYIKTKWSPATIKDMATATDPATILRDLAMMSAYRLWLDYQNLAAGERSEALLAGQLALMTRQEFTAALATQKAAATRGGNSAGAS